VYTIYMYTCAYTHIYESRFVYILCRCVHKKHDKSTIAPGQETIDTDGLIAIGEHPAAWQNQLKVMGIIGDLIIAICIDAAGSSPPEPAGFLSFGNLYGTSTAGKIVWTNMLEPKDKW
jgi:hypothetical protein